jgi:predicted amidophosphoribosyltransferase
MSFLKKLASLFTDDETAATVTTNKTVFCHACGQDTSNNTLKRKDGVYCKHCGALIDYHHLVITSERSNQALCRACSRTVDLNIMLSQSKKILPNGEGTAKCYMCESDLHHPEGRCSSCWGKLADNKVCVNRHCPK